LVQSLQNLDTVDKKSTMVNGRPTSQGPPRYEDLDFEAARNGSWPATGPTEAENPTYCTAGGRLDNTRFSDETGSTCRLVMKESKDDDWVKILKWAWVIIIALIMIGGIAALIIYAVGKNSPANDVVVVPIDGTSPGVVMVEATTQTAGMVIVGRGSTTKKSKHQPDVVTVRVEPHTTKKPTTRKPGKVVTVEREIGSTHAPDVVIVGGDPDVVVGQPEVVTVRAEPVVIVGGKPGVVIGQPEVVTVRAEPAVVTVHKEPDVVIVGGKPGVVIVGGKPDVVTVRGEFPTTKKSTTRKPCHKEPWNHRPSKPCESSESKEDEKENHKVTVVSNPHKGR